MEAQLWALCWALPCCLQLLSSPTHRFCSTPCRPKIHRSFRPKSKASQKPENLVLAACDLY